MTPTDYTSFKALAFDIYGTLIDWETPIITKFSHHSDSSSPSSVSRDDTIKIFRKHERSIQQRSPRKLYQEIADEAAELTNEELCDITGVTTRLSAEGVNIAEWPAFADTVESMKRLKRYYKLIALSNIDTLSFSATLSGPLKEVEFDAKYIAEDIGSYKPDPTNFEYLISHAEKEFGIGKDGICMVAHGLETDHAVLPKVAMKSGVWIMRGDGERLEGQADEIGVGARFETLREFADAVEKAFRKIESGKRKEEGVADTLVELEEKGIGGS